MRILKKITAHNFASFGELTLPLTDLTVLVGPNGSGKSNLLKLFRFLGETARTDLGPAVAEFGGFDQLLFRGTRGDNRIRVTFEAQFTQFASARASDQYDLKFWVRGRPNAGFYFLEREESFFFKRTSGRGRRITLSGRDVSVQLGSEKKSRVLEVQETASGLSILRRLNEDVGAPQIEELVELFETLRVFDVNVVAARTPSIVPASRKLASDGSNLAGFLTYLSKEAPELFIRISDDMREVLPGLKSIEVRSASGAAEARVILIHEHGLSEPTPLALASYGTVRALALFTMLSDPEPPKLTCVEEIDHGLHPYALDRLVERLRTASEITQLVVATHSPALVNRLHPSELVLLERDLATGGTRNVPITLEILKEIEAEGAYGLGELWFSGVLGGVPN